VSGPFAPLDIALTGLGFNQFWMDTISHNVANVNTMTATSDQPFRARMVVAQPLDTNGVTGGGVAVGAVFDQDGDPPMVYDPENPLADAKGNVQGTLDDLGGQLSNMILASRSYQANITVHKEAREALEAATTLGKAS
jgi:flagellar basal-body rod protein FlgC